MRCWSPSPAHVISRVAYFRLPGSPWTFVGPPPGRSVAPLACTVTSSAASRTASLFQMIGLRATRSARAGSGTGGGLSAAIRSPSSAPPPAIPPTRAPIVRSARTKRLVASRHERRSRPEATRTRWPTHADGSPASKAAMGAESAPIAEQARIGGLGDPTVDEVANEALGGLEAAAAREAEVGDDAVEPRPRIVRHALRSRLPDQPEERLGDEVVGDIRVARQGAREAEEVPAM